MADQNLTQKTATTTISSDDLLYVLRDPNGTPVDRKMAFSDLATAVNATAPTAPIYPDTLIPYGDGTTAGGTTNANFFIDFATGDFQVYTPGFGTRLRFEPNQAALVFDDGGSSKWFQTGPSGTILPPLGGNGNGFATIDNGGTIGFTSTIPVTGTAYIVPYFDAGGAFVTNDTSLTFEPQGSADQRFAVSLGSSPHLSVSTTTNGLYSLGAGTPGLHDGNGTFLFGDDSAQTYGFYGLYGGFFDNPLFLADFLNGTVKLGVPSGGNGNNIILDDANGTISTISPTGIVKLGDPNGASGLGVVLLDNTGAGAGGDFAFGSIGIGSAIHATGGDNPNVELGAVDSQGNSTLFQINDSIKTSSQFTMFSDVTLPVFSGSGLDDMTRTIFYSGNVNRTYTITIDSEGSPDTVTWTDGTTTMNNVPIVNPIELSDNINVSFGTDTGHTLGDSWSFDVTVETRRSSYEVGQFGATGQGVSADGTLISLLFPVGTKVGTNLLNGGNAYLVADSQGFLTRANNHTSVVGDFNGENNGTTLTVDDINENYTLNKLGDGATTRIVTVDANHVLGTIPTNSFITGSAVWNELVVPNQDGILSSTPDMIFNNDYFEHLFQYGDLTQTNRATIVGYADSYEAFGYGVAQVPPIPTFNGVGLNTFFVTGSYSNPTALNYTVTINGQFNAGTGAWKSTYTNLTGTINVGDTVTNTTNSETATVIWVGNGYFFANNLSDPSWVGSFTAMTFSGGATAIVNSTNGYDTFTWTDGVYTSPTLPTFDTSFPLTSGLSGQFGAQNGYTDTDNWTFTPTPINYRFLVDIANGIYGLGALSSGNGNFVRVDDPNNLIELLAPAGVVSLGFYDGGHSSTNLKVDTTNNQIRAYTSNQTLFQMDNASATIDFGGAIFNFGTVSGDNRFQVDAAATTATINPGGSGGNGTTLIVDDSTQEYTLNKLATGGASEMVVADTTGVLSTQAIPSSSLTLQTNGTPNGDQTLLNLAAGTNITLTDNGTGTVTIDATGGSGSPAGSDTYVQYNNSGSFGADSNFRRPSTGLVISGTDGGSGTASMGIEAGNANGMSISDGTSTGSMDQTPTTSSFSVNNGAGISARTEVSAAGAILQYADSGASLTNIAQTTADGFKVVVGSTKEIALAAASGDYGLYLDFNARTYALGDSQIFNNGTVFTVNDATQLFTLTNVPTFADDAAAAGGGLTTGQLYKNTLLGVTSLCIVP